MPNSRPVCFLTHNAKNNGVGVGPYIVDQLRTERKGRATGERYYMLDHWL